MGLTSSIEKTFEDDEINYETNGNYSKWHDIKEELSEERLMDKGNFSIPICTPTDDIENNDHETTSSSCDDTELRDTVSKFVDEIIEDAVSKYNRILEKRKIEEEDMFQRIPSTDELYEHSLEAHLEKCYEYKDEIKKLSESEERSEESEDHPDSHDEESEEHIIIRRKRSKLTQLIINLRDASLEFMEEINGNPYFDDYDSDDEQQTINELISQYLESERPNIEEFKRNCVSLKTSYNVVCENMKGVYERHPRIIKFLINWCVCYYLIMLFHQYR